jgi:uncharacterized membrane protein HdeD (DUF308 family)
MYIALKVLRIFIGVFFISYGIIHDIALLYIVGIIPLLAGIISWCPLDVLTTGSCHKIKK